MIESSWIPNTNLHADVHRILTAQLPNHLARSQPRTPGSFHTRDRAPIIRSPEKTFLVRSGSGVFFHPTVWTIAFVLFLRVYTPILFRPRVDLRPG